MRWDPIRKVKLKVKFSVGPRGRVEANGLEVDSAADWMQTLANHSVVVELPESEFFCWSDQDWVAKLAANQPK
jgi:hypothetical protein